jgi:ABC-type antimicrobial peptide transport system permease subunit
VKEWTLVRDGLRFYRRTHLGVLGGCAISAAVLVGALFVGDSVRGSLQELALSRVGRIEFSLDSGQRYFGDSLSSRLREGLRAKGAAVLRVEGMALRDDPGSAGPRQVNRVDVLGVDREFLGLAEKPSAIALGPGELAVNEKLAWALGVRAGDDVALRIGKPSLLSRDAPLASLKGRETVRARLRLAAVLSPAELGRFSLRSDQAAPYNAFVDRGWLEEQLELSHRANLLVLGDVATAPDPLVRAQAALRTAWTLEDAGLVVRSPAAPGVIQLQSTRIYLDPAVARRALELEPQAVGVLSYLVNSIARGALSTPYSFVTALSPGADRDLGPVSPEMKDDEILVNQWLAEQLAVHKGDSVTLSYSVPGAGLGYTEKSRSFRVRDILPMDRLVREKELVPEFPGLTDVESCSDWHIGLPMDEQKLKDAANEAYWKKYRQTPKALLTLAAGQEMWANRYGNLMAVRYPASRVQGQEVKERLRGKLGPEEVGLVLQPARRSALTAASQSMDLGQLFLGMSFFLIAASLILTAMLFVFTVEQRSGEMGVLLAVGYSPGRVRRLILAEGGALALGGSLGGVPLGWGFARGLLWGLGSAWKGAVASAALGFHATSASAGVGVLASASVSLLAMALAVWRLTKRPVRELVSLDPGLALEQKAGPGPRGRLRWWVFLGSTAAAVGVAASTLKWQANRPAEGFFAAGALMLVGGVALIRILLGRLGSRDAVKLSVRELGVRSAARRPGRGMAAAGMLACGSFIVLSVSAMKEDLTENSADPRSGTGGFRLYGETSLAVHQDLNDPKGREAFRMTDEAILRGVSIVPLRVHAGDDASCLNLNLAARPTLLGVDPEKLSARGAFAGPDVWGLLGRALPEGVVPGLVGDSATAVWKLMKKVGPEDGDLLEYPDEWGRPFRVKLVGALPPRLSVLQGRILIPDRDFMNLFPSEGGYRAFLVEGPAQTEPQLTAYLSERLGSVGLDLGRSVDRLKEFYAVESAYLMMFLVLGGMGLVLGSAGMGVLVLRNVLERRGELALLRAVGYSQRQAARVVMAEHRWLLFAGMGAGTAASALAISPTLMRPGVQMPYALLGVFLVGTAAFALGWIALAARAGLGAPMIPALRRE